MTQPYHLLPRVGSSMAEEWLDIGLQHHVAGRYPEAEQAYVKGLRIDPNCGPIINNLAVMSAQQNQLLQAQQRFERAALFDEENATIWYNLALSLLEIERVDEALPAINRSLKLIESADALTAKGMILTSSGMAAEAVDSYDAALDKDPKHALASYNAIFARTLKHTTPADNHAARKRWYENHRWVGEKRQHDNDRTPDRILRVGYVGGDFKMHSAAFIFGSVVLNHDRAAIEPFCYMSMQSDPAKDLTTKSFMEKTIWRDISAKSDDEAEAMIREDKIDMLVDLSGHTGGNRLPLFTRKPAPIQAHAWGFAHGSGIPEIDYFLADTYSLPISERKHFTEKVWDLPSIVGYLPPEYGQPGVSQPPCSRDGVFTFGVFGRFEKLSAGTLEAYRRIVERTPGSRIIFKDAMMRRPHVIRSVREAMRGVDPKRVLFAQDTSHPEQMLAYQGVDLVLDTFPHTGGVTALEILFMGVPVVTLYNGQVGGRTTAVVLKAMGREAWVASSIDEYVDKASTLAAERASLGEARAKLRDEFKASIICGTGYAREVERAYRQMWWRYCGHDADLPGDADVLGPSGAGGIGDDADHDTDRPDSAAVPVRRHARAAGG